MDNLAAHEPALRARAASRFGVALAAWAAAGLLSSTVPDLSANRGLVLLYYLSLTAAAVLVLLAVAAQEVPAANRAADRLEGWVIRAMTRPLLLRLIVSVSAAFLFIAGGVAELVVYTTIPGNAADPNPHLVMLWFLFFMAGILLVFLRVAAPDLPDGENAVARLELEDML